MSTPDQGLIHRVAQRLSQTPGYAETGSKSSILVATANAYGRRAELEEVTQPTGFDPGAARVFEAIIESAFVVAHADGHFDDVERAAFQHVVLEACAGAVEQAQVSALLADLDDQLAEDGTDKRLEMIGRAIERPDQAREVLRVAALLAHVSGGVSDVERSVMDRLRARMGLDAEALEASLSDAARALSE